MTLYSSSYRCNTSLWGVIKESVTLIMKYRWQILLAIKSKIKATYQQDVLGLFWSFFMPVIPMGVYMVLAEIKVFNTSDVMPFVFYIATGMTIWLLMADIMRKVMYAIKKDKSILTTTDFPILVVMLSEFGEVIHDTLIRFVVLGGIIWYYGVDITLFGALLAFLALIPALFVAFALGIMLSISDVIIQDTRRLVGIFLRYGLFVSSVIFPFPTEGIFGAINQFNFFNTYVNVVRDALFYGHYFSNTLFIYTSIFALFLLMFTLKLIYSLEYKIRAYL